MRKKFPSRTRWSNKPHFFIVKKLRVVSVSLFQWLLALAFLPLLWAAGKTVLSMVPALHAEGVRAWWLYAAGAFSYLFFEKLISKPLKIYVIGHELTHAVSGLLSGAKIHSFKARESGGEVRLSKTNLFIALSPYIIPIYTVFLIALYAVLQKWWPKPWAPSAFQFLVGLTLMFHLSMTYSAVHLKQPDLKLVGVFLSGVLILLGNTLILGFLGVSLFSRTPTVKQYVSEITHETFRIWKKSMKQTKDYYTLWIH